MAIRVADFHAKAAQAAQQQGYLAIERRGGEDRLVVRGTSWFGRLFGALRPGSDSRSVIRAYRTALLREHPGLIDRLPGDLRGQLDGTRRVRAVRLIQATRGNRDVEQALMAPAREKRRQLLNEAIGPRMGPAVTGALQRLHAAGVLGPRDVQVQELDPGTLQDRVLKHLTRQNLRSDALDASADEVVRDYALQRRPLFEAIDRHCAERPAEAALYRAYAARPDADLAIVEALLVAGPDHRQQFTQCLRDIALAPAPQLVETAAQRLLTLLQQPVVAQLQGDGNAGTLNAIAGQVLELATLELEHQGVTPAQLYGRLVGSDTFMGGMTAHGQLFGAAALNPGFRLLAAPFNTLMNFGNTLQQAARAAGAVPAGEPDFNTLFDADTPITKRFVSYIAGADGVERPDLIPVSTKAMAEQVFGVRFPLASDDDMREANHALAVGCNSASAPFAAYVAEKSVSHPALADAGSALSIALRRAADETLPARIEQAASVDSGQGEWYPVFALSPDRVEALLRECLDEALAQAGAVA